MASISTGLKENQTSIVEILRDHRSTDKTPSALSLVQKENISEEIMFCGRKKTIALS